jgi:Xaa-Pro aminopeptidase
MAALRPQSDGNAPMDTRTADTTWRLAAVREALARHGAAALLVPSSDPHLSEYLPERWQGRQWLSGFTGSAGIVAVTADAAALFTDSRYWVQAEAELAGTGIELVRVPTGAPSHVSDWLIAHVARGGTVAVDGQVLGLATAQAWRGALEAAGLALRTDVDLLGEVWPDRPPLPAAPVVAHRPPQAARSCAEKLAQLRAAMDERKATHHFVSTVDDIAWITNLRGSDVAYNPVFLAHLLLDAQGATLFVGAGKIDAALRAALAADGVALAPYDDAAAALAALPAGSRLWLDPRRVTQAFRECVPAGVEVVEALNPSVSAKSRKSDAEAAFIREAMIEDGVAMCAFYAWFEQALARGERLTELTVDERLSAQRAQRPGFVGLSFPTIAGFNGNGSMPHYRATAASHARIEGDGLLLIDSGAQYLGGTTDITRVWPIGEPSEAMRRDYTLVLKGMMALSRTRFPRGTPGPMLDAIARAPLWAEGLDFGHGTGHGVGYFLNVHEGPQSISKAVPTPEMAMETGMVTSIEPGVYRAGRWGVRIENLVLTVAAATAEDATTFGEMLDFETLTLCPIDTRCIDRRLLRADEVAWLDRYHALVRERLAPRLDGDARAWLEARTQPL